MRAQISNDCVSRVRTYFPPKRSRGQSSERGQIGYAAPQGGVGFPSLLALVAVRECELACIERQVPPVLRWQLGETAHRRPIQPLTDDLIEGKRTTFAGAIRIPKSYRRRIEFGGIGAMPIAPHTMAARTILSIERRTASEIRGFRWCERNRIDGQEVRSQRTRGPRDVIRLRFGPNQAPKCLRLSYQARPIGGGGQASDLGLDRARELGHLRIFLAVLDLAIGHGAPVIHRHIVKQPPGRLHVFIA